MNTLTLLPFLTENWSRPKDEVIFDETFSKFLKKEFNRILRKQHSSLCAVGDLNTSRLVKEELAIVIEKTKNNTGMVLTLSLELRRKRGNYSMQ